GYVEIGSTGRYASVLKKRLRLRGTLAMVSDVAPTRSPVDIVERGQLAPLGTWVPLDNYAPIGADRIPGESVDFVSCYIGLHHIEPRGLEPFVRSIRRIVRPGGVFILRDHDVKTKEMDTFVSLAHTVFNAGLGVPWETNRQELRQFWQGYGAVYSATRKDYPFNFGYHVMVMVIGTSTTAEYALRAAYETLIGRLGELTATHGLTDEDRYAAAVAQDYVDFIRIDP